MINLGTFTPFHWHDKGSDIRPNVVHKLHKIDFVVNTVISSADLVNVVTLSPATLSVINQTYMIGGQTIERSRISGSIPSTGKYFIKLNNAFYTDLIEKDTCGSIIKSTNLCNDTFYSWDTDSLPVELFMPSAQDDLPTIESKKEIIVSETGDEERTTRLVTRHNVVFVAPTHTVKMIQSFAANEETFLDGTEIKNISAIAEQLDPYYSKITVSFEYFDLAKVTGCCEELNLDSILAVGGSTGGANCTGFSVSISNSSGTLTASVTNAPIGGTNSFRWYRNGQFVSTGSTLTTNGTYGEFRVEATNTGCVAKNALYIGDPCTSMMVEAYATGNILNANIINPIVGYTIAVKLNGSTVATSLPFTITTAGTYFIYATKDNCVKSDGIQMSLENSDCNYTLNIVENGNELQGTNTAVSPTYLWELETSAGRTSIGTTQNITKQGKGIYWLTVTKGGCSKSDYFYLEPLAESGIYHRWGGTGTTFSVLGINLLGITNHTGTIRVTVNGVQQNYINGTPTSPNTYTVNGSGALVFNTSYTNPSIIVELI